MGQLEELPRELLILIFDYLIPCRDCPLLRLALTSHKVGDAATDVLYRVVSLTTEKQLQRFGRLLIRRYASSRSLFSRVRSLSTEGGDLFDERLAARIIDACPNLLSVQTNAHILFDLCATRRSYRTLFCLSPGVYWPDVSRARPHSEGYFVNLERLHVPGLQEPFTPRAITPETFPRLRYFSALLEVGYHGKMVASRFVRDFLRALLSLAKLERALFIVDPLFSDHLYPLFQETGDRRVYLAADTYWSDYPEPEQTVWYHTMYHMHDIFRSGVPALELKPVGSLPRPPRCIDFQTMDYWVP